MHTALLLAVCVALALTALGARAQSGYSWEPAILGATKGATARALIQAYVHQESGSSPLVMVLGRAQEDRTRFLVESAAEEGGGSRQLWFLHMAEDLSAVNPDTPAPLPAVTALPLETMVRAYDHTAMRTAARAEGLVADEPEVPEAP
jgi:hypothetical protein